MNIFMLGEITAATAEKFLSTPFQQVSGGDTVILSSPGGDVGYMLAMYDAIRRGSMNTLSVGIVQSAAAVLSQAGARRYALPNTLFRFHKPDPDPKTGEIPELAWYLHSLSVNLVVNRLDIAVIEGYDFFDGCFINAQRALELNLIDKILEV